MIISGLLSDARDAARQGDVKVQARLLAAVVAPAIYELGKEAFSKREILKIFVKEKVTPLEGLSGLESLKRLNALEELEGMGEYGLPLYKVLLPLEQFQVGG